MFYCQANVLLCFVTDWSAREKEHLGEEISDVLIYLVRLADKCDVNLPAALNDKIAKNARKYPAELVRICASWYFGFKALPNCCLLPVAGSRVLEEVQ